MQYDATMTVQTMSRTSQRTYRLLTIINLEPEFPFWPAKLGSIHP
jgi:hypothetical protein